MVPESHKFGEGLSLLLPPCNRGIWVPISAPVQAETWPGLPTLLFNRKSEGMRIPWIFPEVVNTTAPLAVALSVARI